MSASTRGETRAATSAHRSEDSKRQAEKTSLNPVSFPPNGEHHEIARFAERLHLYRLPCAHPAVKKVWNHGAAARNVRERYAHRRWIKKSRPRWTARADTWSAEQVKRATVKRSCGRCIAVPKDHKIDQRRTRFSTANPQWGRKSCVCGEPWTANSRDKSKCAAK